MVFNTTQASKSFILTSLKFYQTNKIKKHLSVSFVYVIDDKQFCESFNGIRHGLTLGSVMTTAPVPDVNYL